MFRTGRRRYGFDLPDVHPQVQSSLDFIGAMIAWIQDGIASGEFTANEIMPPPLKQIPYSEALEDALWKKPELEAIAALPLAEQGAALNAMLAANRPSKANVQSNVNVATQQVQDVIFAMEDQLNAVADDPSAFVEVSDALIADLYNLMTQYSGQQFMHKPVELISDYIKLIQSEQSDLQLAISLANMEAAGETLPPAKQEALERQQARNETATRRESLQDKMIREAEMRGLDEQSRAEKKAANEQRKANQAAANKAAANANAQRQANEQAKRNANQAAANANAQAAANQAAANAANANIPPNTNANIPPANWGPRNTNEPVIKNNSNANANALALQAKVNAAEAQKQQLMYAAAGILGLGVVYSVFFRK